MTKTVTNEDILKVIKLGTYSEAKLVLNKVKKNYPKDYFVIILFGEYINSQISLKESTYEHLKWRQLSIEFLEVQFKNEKEFFKLWKIKNLKLLNIAYLLKGAQPEKIKYTFLDIESLFLEILNSKKYTFEQVYELSKKWKQLDLIQIKELNYLKRSIHYFEIGCLNFDQELNTYKEWFRIKSSLP